MPLWKLRKSHTKRHYVDGSIRLKSNANGNVKLLSAGLMKQVTVSVSLDECYVVHNRKAVVVNSANFSSPDKAAIKQIISDIIEKLRT